ncbi:MAG: protein kinase [Clostridia bacterium]|nr:protein kinase [Clostridia bacterium]
MTNFEVGTRVFDTWMIQHCVTQENEYSHFIIQAGHDDQTIASLWVVRFPATQDDLLILRENGMTVEDSITFFKQAAEDYIGSLLMTECDHSENLLLSVDDCAVEYDEATNTSTVLLRTAYVESLSQYMEKNAIDEETALRIAYKLCDAVAYVRNNELPRRLLTIDNIFVDRNGNFLLGCFGSVADNRFQSPEEHRGEETLYNSDVNSIGVILYTILNDGRIPLLPRNLQNPSKEDIAIAVQDRHAGMPFPPPANAGRSLTTVILKACAFKSKARYASVEELKNALVNLRTVNIKSVDSDSTGEKIKPKHLHSAKKIIFSALTVIVIIIGSVLLIDLFTDDVPSNIQNFPPTETTSQKGMTVIIHTDPISIDIPSTPVSVPEQSSNQNTEDNAYPDSFFSQIAIYHSGNYHMTGILEQDGESKPTELAVTKDNTVYMTSDIDGLNVGLLRDKESNIYLVNPKGKSCLELSTTVLKFLGMDTSSLDKAASSAQSHTGFVYPHSVSKEKYREQEFIRASYTFDNGKMEVFYLDDSGNVKYIESYADANTLSNIMIVQSLNADVAAEYKGITDAYTVYSGISGMFSFVSNLATE